MRISVFSLHTPHNFFGTREQASTPLPPTVWQACHAMGNERPNPYLETSAWVDGILREHRDMPITRLLQGTDFDHAHVEAITSAFEDILRELHIPSTDPLAKIIAKNVIRFAGAGERDPARLRERATEFLRD